MKMEVIYVAPPKISDDTIEKLRGIFLSLDDDHSGTLSAKCSAA